MESEAVHIRLRNLSKQPSVAYHSPALPNTCWHLHHPCGLLHFRCGALPFRGGIPPNPCPPLPNPCSAVPFPCALAPLWRNVWCERCGSPHKCSTAPPFRSRTHDHWKPVSPFNLLPLRKPCGEVHDQGSDLPIRCSTLHATCTTVRHPGKSLTN
jgi:hypothetical protein